MTDEYADQLEEAVNLLWGWMPVQQVREIQRDAPELAQLCHTIHLKVDHGESPHR